MCLEYIEEGDCLNALLAPRVFPPVATFRFASQILEALRYIHLQNFAHRDVKLENIGFIYFDTPYILFKLGDFGLAKISGRYDGCKTFCGTLEYMAPEVASTRVMNICYGQQVDMWAFGISLYIITTGESPYEDDGDHWQQVSDGRVSLFGQMPLLIRVAVRTLLIRDPRLRSPSSDTFLLS